MLLPVWAGPLCNERQQSHQQQHAATPPSDDCLLVALWAHAYVPTMRQSAAKAHPCNAVHTIRATWWGDGVGGWVGGRSGSALHVASGWIRAVLGSQSNLHQGSPQAQP